MQFLKLWWMAFWRVAIVYVALNDSPSSGIVGAFGFSLVIAAVTVGVFGLSIRTFPLIRLVARKPVVMDLRKNPQLDKDKKHGESHGEG